MTDDKGAGKWPYYGHLEKGPGYCGDECLACAFISGRKAEREITARLIMYARHRDSCGDMDAQNHDEFPSCSCGLDGLKDEIRGGQDEK